MKKLIALVLMVSMVAFVFVDVSRAADPNMPKRPMFDPNAIRGMVVVEKDANGVITAVKVENRRRGTWNVVLDAKGKELGETMANKLVTVIGKETTKDDQKWLTVGKYTEMKRPEGYGGPGDPNRPRRPGGPGGPPPGAPGEGGK